MNTSTAYGQRLADLERRSAATDQAAAEALDQLLQAGNELAHAMAATIDALVAAG